MKHDQYPTNFIESNALLAVQSGDMTTANLHLSNLTDYELTELKGACLQLADLCGTWQGAGLDLST